MMDDNQRIEPEYVLIIPTILVNGADWIDTGWMTKILNYNNLRNIMANIKRMLDGEEQSFKYRFGICHLY